MLEHGVCFHRFSYNYMLIIIYYNYMLYGCSFNSCDKCLRQINARVVLRSFLCELLPQSSTEDRSVIHGRKAIQIKRKFQKPAVQQTSEQREIGNKNIECRVEKQHTVFVV